MLHNEDWSTLLTIAPTTGSISFELPQEIQAGEWGLTIKSIDWTVFSWNLDTGIDPIATTRRTAANDFYTFFLNDLRGEMITVNVTTPTNVFIAGNIQASGILGRAHLKANRIAEAPMGILYISKVPESDIDKSFGVITGTTFLNFSISTDKVANLPLIVSSGKTYLQDTQRGKLYSCSPFYLSLKFTKLKH
jgi:hypothetical protein